MASNPSEIRFLVLGTGRSGTTLVQRLCCELPEVWVPQETHFWAIAEEAIDRFEFPVTGPLQRQFADWVAERLTSWSIEVDPERLMNGILASPRRLGLFTMFEAVVASLSPQRAILGEKTPTHIAWWGILTRSRPELKLVFVVRDPRSVLLSQRAVPWGEPNAFIFSERWLLHQRSVVDAQRLLETDRVLVLRYEDVVMDPRAAQSRLASFLGTEDEPEALSADLLQKHGLFAHSEDWKKKALDSVTSDRVSTWQDGQLSEQDIGIIQAVCGELMARFSYPLSGPTQLPKISEEARRGAAAYRRSFLRLSSLSDMPII